MARLTKLQRSNKAHERLVKKHERIRLSTKGRDHDIAFTKSAYHSRVLFTQKKIGRVLTPAEKKKAYDTVIFEFF